jgi:hypothetical protein
MTINETIKLKQIEVELRDNNYSIDFMVKNIQLLLDYSNGCAAAEYARRNNISYQGARKQTKERKVENVGGVPFCFNVT